MLLICSSRQNVSALAICRNEHTKTWQGLRWRVHSPSQVAGELPHSYLPCKSANTILVVVLHSINTSWPAFA